MDIIKNIKLKRTQIITNGALFNFLKHMDLNFEFKLQTNITFDLFKKDNDIFIKISPIFNGSNIEITAKLNFEGVYVYHIELIGEYIELLGNFENYMGMTYLIEMISKEQHISNTFEKNKIRMKKRQKGE